MLCAFLQYGGTALHYAADGGNTEVVELLLNRHHDLITRTDIVSEQIIQFSIIIHDHTLTMMEVAGIVAPLHMCGMIQL